MLKNQFEGAVGRRCGVTADWLPPPVLLNHTIQYSDGVSDIVDTLAIPEFFQQNWHTIESASCDLTGSC
jgi:hypothetical protein